MLSSMPGGSFTLLSPSYDFSVATSSGGGTATISCSSGIETAVLSQGSGSTVYTITPTTHNCADASAPIITISPSSTNVTSHSATIGWITNIAADSTVSYGTTTSYGATSTDPTLVYAHSIGLTGLSAATLYNYEVTSAEYGTSTTSGNYTFTTASTDAPTVSITAPTNGATVQGTNVTLSAVATPSAGNTIASVQFLVNGTDVGSPVSSAPYQYSWDSTTVSDGNHTVAALVTDSQGHQSTSAAIPITVENDAAVLTFSPSAGTYSTTQSVIISCATPSNAIYYTTDGTTPTASSTAYATPVSVSASETLNAICTATGYINGATASASYVIQTPISASSGGGGGGSAYDISIDNGATTTATPSVTLSLYGSGAYTMQLSNTSNFSSSTWIPYATSLPWTLASSTGEQTVFVEFRSVSGSIVGSAQASIDLTTPSVQTIASATSTAGLSVSQMESLLVSLEAQLQTLEAQASGTTSFVFTRNLSLWNTGNDVKQLQLFLISKNSGSAAAKLAKHGTTDVFGMLTFNALVEFQKKAGITPTSGYFGPITRNYINNLANKIL
jgi:hypothetical protein